MTKKEKKKILKLAEGKKYIYVDCFDTLVHRKTSPQYSFYRLAGVLKAHYSLPFSFESLYLSLSKSFFARCNRPFEQTAEDIYLHYRDYISDSEEQFLALVKKTFIEAELETVVMDENAADLVRKLKREGKTLYLLSDFYLGKEFFQELLDRLSFGDVFTDLFSSADYGAIKWDGSLYSLVKKPEESLMFGDNRISDYRMPRSLHLDAFLVSSNRYMARYERYNQNYEKNSLRELYSIRNRKKDSFVVNYGYVLYLSLRKLYSLLQPEDVVFFLARDGAFLKTCFDALLSKENEKKIRTVYLPNSRLAVLIASMDVDGLTPESLHQLLVSHSQWPVASSEDLLTELGFDPSEQEKLLVQTRKETAYQGKDYFTSEEYQNLVNSPLFRSELKVKQQEGVEKFRTLISPRKGNRLITVDLGWQGTAQNDMRKILDPNIELIGYYLATTFCIGERPHSQKIGLWFDYFNDPDLRDNSSFFAVEPLLKTNQGQLICYRRGEDLYLPDSGKRVYEEYSKPRQEECLTLFRQLMALDSRHPLSEESLRSCFARAKKKERASSLAYEYYYYQLQNGNNVENKVGPYYHLYGIKMKWMAKFPRLYQRVRRLYRKIKH